MKLTLLIGPIFFLASILHAEEQKASLLKFPYVRLIAGKVLHVEKGITEHPLKKSEIFKEGGIVKTSDKSFVQVELDENSSITVFENSEVYIPGVKWDDSITEAVELKKGEVKYKVRGDSERPITSPLTSDAYSDAELVMNYNPNLGRTEMLVLSGSVRFRGLENEEDITLKAGQKCAFQGILEANVPAYDILLKGRKVAKGKLTTVETVETKDLEKFGKKSQTDDLIKKFESKVIVRQPGQICEKPFAKLNECAWICEGLKKGSKSCRTEDAKVHCVRKKCDANGIWSDRFEYPAGQNKCQTATLVGACDY